MKPAQAGLVFLNYRKERNAVNIASVESNNGELEKNSQSNKDNSKNNNKPCNGNNSNTKNVVVAFFNNNGNVRRGHQKLKKKVKDTNFTSGEKNEEKDTSDRCGATSSFEVEETSSDTSSVLELNPNQDSFVLGDKNDLMRLKRYKWNKITLVKLR